jgi:hypothetical protein
MGTAQSPVVARAATGVPAPTSKSSEDVAVGDSVLARDPDTGRTEPRRVVQTYHRVSDHLRILQLAAAGDPASVQELRTTDEHPFWSPRFGWVNAGDLRVGQSVEQLDGTAAVVVGTQREEHPEGVPVYNIETEDDHTYFVAAHGSRSLPVLVHNCNQPRGGTYKIRDADGTVKRTGRSKDLQSRQRQHARDPETKDLDFEVDKRTDDYAAQRGREQLIHDEHPEARAENGGLNKNRPIRPDNPRRDEYMEAGRSLE